MGGPTNYAPDALVGNVKVGAGLETGAPPEQDPGAGPLLLTHLLSTAGAMLQPQVIADLIIRHPRDRHAMFMLLQLKVGNRYTQGIIDLMRIRGADVSDPSPADVAKAQEAADLADIERGPLGQHQGGSLGPPGIVVERENVLAEARARIDAASASFADGLRDVELAKIVEKQPAARTSFLGRIAMFVVTDRVGMLIKMVGLGSFGTAVALKLSSIAIDAIAEVSQPTSENTLTKDQNQDLAMLKSIGNASHIAFSRLRTAAITDATDEQLKGLVAAFKPEDHSKDIYAKEINDKLDRYHESGLVDHALLYGDDIDRNYKNAGWTTTKGGARIRTGLGHQAAQLGHEESATRQIARVYFWSNEPPRYGYQLTAKKDTPMDFNTEEYHTLQMPYWVDNLQQDPGGTPVGTNGAPRAPATIDVIDGFVPIEFEHEAVRRQQEVFGVDPQTVIVDDSDPLAYGIPRATAALANKRAVAEGLRKTFLPDSAPTVPLIAKAGK